MSGMVKLAVGAAGAVAAFVAAMLVMVIVLTSMMSGPTQSLANYLAACQPTGGVTYGDIGNIENPTPEEVAAIIYAQVTGWGYGDWAAMMAIHSNNFETTFQNLARGDPWKSGAGMTGSRGLFQQFPDAVPPELAWSGRSDPGYGNDYGMYDESNAWGPGGWALRDPRMNPFQATNMFILGKDKGGTPIKGQRGWWGLDNPTAPNYRLFKTDGMPTEQQAYDTMWNIQGFTGNEDERKSSLAKWNQSVELFKRIKSGEIAVPRFVPPMDFMARHSSDTITQGYFNSGKSIVPTAGYTNRSSASATRPAQTTSASSNGVLFLGDSIMVGLLEANDPSPEMFGGPVVTHSLIGVNLNQVLNAKTASFKGTTENMEKWRNSISTGPSKIVVSLGTNPTGMDDGKLINEFMTLADGRDVYWFSQHYAPAEPMQQSLEANATRYPNLHLVPVLDLLPSQQYQPAGAAGMHPVTAYPQMWERAMEQMRNGGASSPGGSLADCLPGTTGDRAANPGSTELPGPDSTLPLYGFTVNTPGGNNMTYYSQGDSRWNPPNTRYNFAQCGCGTTSIAMIIATLANELDYTPLTAAPEQARLGGITGGYPNGCGSYQDSFMQMARNYNLDVKRGTSDVWPLVDETLKKGGLVTLSVTGIKEWSSSGHIIVVRGITADGKYLIADPNNSTGMDYTVNDTFARSDFKVKTGVVAVLPPGATF